MCQILFDEGLWSVVPTAECTVELNANVFMGLSQCRARIVKELSDPHSRPAWKALLTAQHPELAAPLKQELQNNPHVFDSWSRKFMKYNDLE
eukprot:1302175-Pyramimonas_sp.AAC.1